MGCAQHGLGKIDATARLEDQLKLGLANEIAVFLGTYFSPNVIGTEQRLLHLHVGHANEREAERFHWLLEFLGIVDHAMGGQVDAAVLGASERRIVLARKVHRHIFAKQQNTVRTQQRHILAGDKYTLSRESTL